MNIDEFTRDEYREAIARGEFTDDDRRRDDACGCDDEPEEEEDHEAAEQRTEYRRAQMPSATGRGAR